MDAATLFFSELESSLPGTIPAFHCHHQYPCGTRSSHNQKTSPSPASHQPAKYRLETSTTKIELDFLHTVDNRHDGEYFLKKLHAKSQ